MLLGLPLKKMGYGGVFDYFKNLFGILKQQ